MLSYNILLGANAQLPDTTKGNQISIGTSAETVYFASSTAAGGVRAGAAGFAIAGAAAITASGEAGAAGAPLMSGGGAAPYWGSITQLTGAAAMTLPPRLTKSYAVTGSTPWELTLPAPAGGAGLWLKNESSATGTVTAPGGVVSWGSTTGASVTLPPGASSPFASDQSRWYALGPAPPPLAVAAVSPNTGDVAGTTIVTITGTGFASGATVTIGGVAAAVTYVNSNTLSVVTGAASAGTYSITVTNPGGATATGGSYTYAASAPPTVLAISPSSGNLASMPVVTITGSCFKSGAIQSVTIGGILVQNMVCANDSTITGTAGVAPAPNPAASVVVTTTNGSNAANALFSYTQPPPVITSISPAVGDPAGGTTVTLTGMYFLGATSVSFGSAAASFTVLSDTQISAVTAAASGGGLTDVFPQVTAVGTSTNSTVVYTYTSTEIPTVLQALAPIVAPGDQITIVGANFTGATKVRIDNDFLFSYAVVDDSHITITAIPNTAGSVVNIFVTNANGESTTHASVTYQTGSQTFSATGENQIFVVPPGATNATAIISGSPGAVFGGAGASITGAFPITGGEIYTIVCGDVSTYAGGSVTVYDTFARPVGGGGGYSGIFRASANVNANGAPTQNVIGGSVILAAGGGGGFTFDGYNFPGGAAGLWSGAYFNSSVGAGGAGGVANSNGTGSPGSGASQFQGVPAMFTETPLIYRRTGGGSGFYGGGASYNGGFQGYLGSGGASFVNPAVNFISSAANSGIGSVTIKYA